MLNTNATNFRKNLFKYLDLAIDFNDVINVSTKKGNVVILSEEDYKGLIDSAFRNVRVEFKCFIFKDI